MLLKTSKRADGKMDILKQIIEEVRQHSYDCEDLDLELYDNPIKYGKCIKCACGKEWNITIFDIMGSKNGEKDYNDLKEAIPLSSTPAFRQARIEWRKKREEERDRERFLQKRKSAIGSLEV